MDKKSLATKTNILLKLKRYSEALEAYEKILKLDPNNTEVKLQKEEAIKELKNEQFSHMINEIKSKLQNKDYSSVIEICDKAIGSNHNNPILYVYKGNSLHELKQYEEAIECYDKALEIDPQNADALNKRKVILDQVVKVEAQSLSKKKIREIKLIRTLEGHSEAIFMIAITTDNTKIVSGSDDKTIKVWDIDTGELLQTLEGHSARVMSLAVTPDNTKIVSGSADNTIKVWQIVT